MITRLREGRKRGEGLTLANKITLVRMLLTVPFLISILHRMYPAALGIGLIVGISDGLDGLVARRYKQQTQLGRFLDPLADKLLLMSTYVALVRTGDMPDWVIVIVFAKDIAVSLGWILSYVLLDSSEVVTLFAGKAATASQMAYAGVVLSARALGLVGPITSMAISLFQCLAVALTLYSLLEYVKLGSRRLARV
jgi:cardiolipin synthase